MRMRELAAVMAGVTFGMAVMPDMTVLAADNNMDYRRKVVGIDVYKRQPWKTTPTRFP